MNTRILFILGASLCTSAPAFAQANNIMEITVRRHANSTDGGAAAKFATASLDLQNVDACADMACCVTLMQSGPTQVFGSSGDGLDVVTSQTELNAVFAAPGHCKVIISGSNSCGTGGGWLGCAQIGTRNMVVVASAPACVWGHEFGHTQGLSHNQACFDLIMHATNFNVEAVQPFECTAFRANPDSTGPPCGPGGGPANDNCASATNLGSLLGNTSFDNTNATTDGNPDAACNFFGTTQIDNDVWYRWTAPCAGDYRFSTVGLTSVDTKLAAYSDQSCPPSGALVCDDDTTGTQSTITLTGASGGSTFLIRLGTFPTAPGGTGSMSITQLTAPCSTGPPNDNCSAADNIGSALGTFAFDNATATTDGNPDALCNFFGTPQIESDVWYRWSAPCDGTYTISTVGLTGVDTKIAAYADQACPPSGALACNDDAAGGLQSSMDLASVTGGSSFLIRIGTFPSAAGGLGSFDISRSGGPCPTGPPNDNCPGASAISGVGTFAFDNVGASTDGFPDAACNKFGSSQIENDVWFVWTVPANGDYRIETCGLTALDTKIAVYGGGSCPAGTGILDCNDDTCGLQSQVNVAGVSVGQMLLLRIGSFDAAAMGSGSFRITQTGRPTGAMGTAYCTAAANSVGPGAIITAVGSRFVADNDLTLNTGGLPPNVFGIYYFGPNATQVAFGEGFRCIAQPTFRIQPAMSANGAGTFSRVIDLTTSPSVGVVLPGVTLNYQHWYRDPTGGPAGFNLSNGLAIGWL